MNDLYKTIASSSEGQFRDKGSRFLAFAYHVETEEEIREILVEIRKRYHDARHHCFAWRLGPEMDLFRVNDDGEPSGSAGKPILGQLRSRELTDTMVVVVRYFGGTLLGVGGLINAYRTAASDALDRASIIEKRVEILLQVEFGYQVMNQVMKLVKEYELGMAAQQFDTRCKLTVRAWIRDLQAIMDRFERIGDCRVARMENEKL
jgi:uncharacterized YigZ family protein